MSGKILERALSDHLHGGGGGRTLTPSLIPGWPTGDVELIRFARARARENESLQLAPLLLYLTLSRRVVVVGCNCVFSRAPFNCACPPAPLLSEKDLNLPPLVLETILQTDSLLFNA